VAPPSPRPRPLRLDADLFVPARDRAGLGAALARAAAARLTDLGIVAPVPAGPAELDRYVETVRAAAALSRTRIHCGLQLRLLDGGRTDLPLTVASRLSHVDYVRLVPAPAAALTRAGIAVAATLPVRVVLAGPLAADADPAAIARACADAGIAIEVSERRRVPSVGVAVALHAAGATLVAGSGARAAAEIGRYRHVREVAAALAPDPHLD
jgi:hypothetical protein